MSSAIDRTADSTYRDPDTVEERINWITTLINLLEAHLLLLTAKTSKGT